MHDFKKYVIPVVFIFVITLLLGFIFKKPSSHSGADHTDQTTMEHGGNYMLEISSPSQNLQPNVLHRITFKVKNENGETLKNFEVVHEKILHLIVVRKDLQGFQHLHPTLDSSTGEFTIDISFDKPGPYSMYADFTPATFEENSQKMPSLATYELTIGDIKMYQAEKVAVNTSPVVNSGDYEVTYTIDPPTEKGLRYILSIKKEGQPVKDLQPYLGAMGHSVLLNTKTLNYVHTHAGEKDVQKVSRGPNLFFSTKPLEKGTYKAFTQFQHEDNVITSEYVFEVQ